MDKRHLTFTIAVLFSALVLVGCERQKAPRSTRDALHLPAPGFVADATRGQQLFQANCAACHGQDGRGTDKGPPLVHAVYRPGHHDDLAFHLAVNNGVRQHHWSFGNMDAVKSVTPEDAADIIAYMRQQQQLAGIK